MVAGPPSWEGVMTCTHCDTKPIEVGMTVVDGHRLTLRSCCSPQWYCDGEAVALPTVLAMMPRRTRRYRRRAA